MSKHGKIEQDVEELRELAETAEARFDARAAEMLKRPQVRKYIDEYAAKARSETIARKGKKAG